MSKKKIMIVEDDASIRRIVVISLKNEGYTDVLECDRGDSATETAYEKRPDLILLDLMLPGRDGISVCRELKANPETAHIPVIMLTAKGEEYDIVTGLDAGADDYVVKPFSKNILLARIRAILRKDSDNHEKQIAFDGLVLDNISHKTTLDGRELSLTLSEYNILELLLSNAGRVFSRPSIIQKISKGEKIVTERTIDVQMVSLRRKLGRWAGHIETIRGVGYRLR